LSGGTKCRPLIWKVAIHCFVISPIPFFQKDFCYPPNVNPISFSRLRREDAILFFPRPRGGFAQKQLKTGNFY